MAHRLLMSSEYGVHIAPTGDGGGMWAMGISVRDERPHHKMQMTLDCMPCFVRQALDAVRMVTDAPDTQQGVLHGVLRWLSEASLQQSPLVTAQRVHRLIRELVCDGDPYLQTKQWSNELALGLYPRVEEMVRDSSEPLEMALRLAIAGNAIDFGPHQHVDKRHVDEAIAHALKSPLNGDLAGFTDAISRAGSILYLTDNAGEIVFDRLLIEQLGPERVTVGVRGMPVLNDATMADAEAAGLIGLVEVIDNGSDAPGTLLDDCSEEFRGRFDQADMVIAKGQGNYESLDDTDREVFLVLKAKCPVIAAQLGCPVLSLVVKRGGCGDEAAAGANLIQQNLRDTSVEAALLPAEIKPA